MNAQRRSSDHPAWDWLMAAGVLVAGAAFAMRWLGKFEGSDFWAALAFAALLIRPDKLVDVVRAWRQRRSQAVAVVKDESAP